MQKKYVEPQKKWADVVIEETNLVRSAECVVRSILKKSRVLSA